MGGIVAVGVEGVDGVAEPLKRPEAIEGGVVGGEAGGVEDLHELGSRLLLGTQQGDDLLGVDDAGEVRLVVEDGERAEVVLVEDLGDFAGGGVDAAADDMTLGEVGDGGLGGGEQELDDGDEAGELVFGVGEVDVGDGLGIALELAQGGDGVAGGGVAGEGDVVGGHEAGGGVGGELEEIFDFLALFGLHLFEDGVGAFFGELGEEIGGGGGIHLFDDVGDLVGVERGEQGLLHLGRDLFEGLGGDLLVKRDEEGLALGGCEFFEDVGDVGGVHASRGDRCRPSGLTRRAGSRSMRSTKSQGMTLGPKRAARRSMAEADGRPLRRRRRAPRGPIFDFADAQGEEGGGVEGSSPRYQIDVVDADDLMCPWTSMIC